MTTADVAVSVQDLHIHYQVMARSGESLRVALQSRLRPRRPPTVVALSDVSLELRAGDSLGVIGHNGAGKTTLLHAIAGVLSPSQGSVLVRHQPQMLGVQAALDPRLSGRRNIELGGLALGLGFDEISELLPSIIDFTELEEFIDLPVSAYSAGMRVRLGFAISTVARPEILLIDEALAVGDKDFREKSIDRLRQLRAWAGVVVLASHALVEVERVCNKVVWLNRGRIEQFGDPTDVLDAYRASRRSSR